MKNKVNLIFIGAVLIGLTAAFTFDLRAIVMPLPIYSWSLLALVTVFDISYFMISRVKRKKSPWGIMLLIFNWLLALSVFIGNNRTWSAFIFLALPFLISAQGILLSSYENREFLDIYFIPEIAHDILIRGFSGCGDFFRNIKSERGGKSVWDAKKLLIVLLALVLAVPAAIIAGSILGSADEIFDNIMGNIYFTDIISILCGIIIFIPVFFLSVSYLYKHENILEKKEEGRKFYRKNKKRAKLPALFSAVFLFVMNIVYTVFSAVQIMYFFTGRTPRGVTLSEYTVSGFGQLIFLTVANIGLLTVAIIFTKKESFAAEAGFKVMGVLLILNNAVMGVSAFMRLSKYEEAYGFTKMRFYGYVLLAATGIFLIYTLIKMCNGKFPIRKATYIRVIIFVTVLSFFDTSGLIARKNVDRYLNGESDIIDVFYLGELGVNAIPELERLCMNAKDESVREQALKEIKDIKRYTGEGSYQTLRDILSK